MSVDIEVAPRATTLVVLPARAVHDAAGAAPWVLRIEDGRARGAARSGSACAAPRQCRRSWTGLQRRRSRDARSAAGRRRRPARPAPWRAMNRWLPFEWIAALRFLREGRMQTIFILAGVAIGVAVIVFMSAMLAGLQANFIKRVLTSQPHIQLLPPDEVARPLRGEPRRHRGRRSCSARRSACAPSTSGRRSAARCRTGRIRRRRADRCRRRRSPCAATPAARSR